MPRARASRTKMCQDCRGQLVFDSVVMAGGHRLTGFVCHSCGIVTQRTGLLNVVLATGGVR